MAAPVPHRKTEAVFTSCSGVPCAVHSGGQLKQGTFSPGGLNRPWPPWTHKMRSAITAQGGGEVKSKGRASPRLASLPKLPLLHPAGAVQGCSMPGLPSRPPATQSPFFLFL